MVLEKGLEKYKHLDRMDYFKKNQSLSKDMWNKEIVPTVADIAEFIITGENKNMDKIFAFFDNKEDFLNMVKREEEAYDEDESANFIRSVMSSNNTDISKAGYFYKLLMASADDFVIVAKDCNSEGVKFKVSDLLEEDYNYRILYSWVVEFNSYCQLSYEDFISKCNELNIESITIKTPLTCKQFPHTSEEVNKEINRRGICKKCAGLLPEGSNNVGTFTTLMVTEHATQSALNSMNKGIKKDVNEMLTTAYKGEYNWESISKWISELVEGLKSKNVFARFYEIALMSRVRFDSEGPYVSSLVGSINRSGNLFGAYIFMPTNKTLQSILRKREFEDHSLKLQIAMNQYIEDKF